MFVLKPHVTGAEGQVTSPDVLVDRLLVDGAPRPVGLLTHAQWHQAEAAVTGRAAYGLMALGGGALILPAVVLPEGPVVVARAAWRLAHLGAAAGQVTLNGVALDALLSPERLVAGSGGQDDRLPRGLLALRSGSAASAAVLDDPVRQRRLTLHLHAEPLGAGRWGSAAPQPRYAEGPTQKAVTHYI